MLSSLGGNHASSYCCYSNFSIHAPFRCSDNFYNNTYPSLWNTCYYFHWRYRSSPCNVIVTQHSSCFYHHLTMDHSNHDFWCFSCYSTNKSKCFFFTSLTLLIAFSLLLSLFSSFVAAITLKLLSEE